ncbi:MAG: hypothetical protein AABZ15_09850 [Nitrospirota bacterium]
MRIIDSEDGVSGIKVMIWLVILGAGFYVGVTYLSVQLDFQRMKDAMSSKASVAQVLKDEEIRNDLMGKAKELGLPLTGESFVVIRDEEKRMMTIKAAWDVEVHYFGGLCGDLCIQTYHFEPVAQEKIITK